MNGKKAGNKRPEKVQDIQVAVGYRLEVEDPEERIEATRITARVEVGGRTYSKTVTVADGGGEILVALEGLKNLPELSEVTAYAVIEDGNKLQGTATVPEDPKIALLASVSVAGTYRPSKSSSQPGSYDLSVNVLVDEPAVAAASGTLTLARPAGEEISFSIPVGMQSATATFRDVPLEDGQVAEVVAELTKNGIGTDVGHWKAEREFNRLTAIELQAFPDPTAPEGGPPKFELRGHVHALLPYGSATGAWSIVGGGAGGGALSYQKRDGGARLAQGGLELLPGSVVFVEATIDGADRDGSLRGEAHVPELEKNRIESATLSGVEDETPGRYSLFLSFAGVIPNGKGALVHISGPVDASRHFLAGGGGGVTGLKVTQGRAFPVGTTVEVLLSIEGSEASHSVPCRWTVPPSAEQEAEAEATDAAAGAEPPPAEAGLPGGEGPATGSTIPPLGPGAPGAAPGTGSADGMGGTDGVHGADAADEDVGKLVVTLTATPESLHGNGEDRGRLRLEVSLDGSGQALEIVELQLDKFWYYRIVGGHEVRSDTEPFPFAVEEVGTSATTRDYEILAPWTTIEDGLKLHFNAFVTARIRLRSGEDLRLESSASVTVPIQPVEPKLTLEVDHEEIDLDGQSQLRVLPRLEISDQEKTNFEIVRPRFPSRLFADESSKGQPELLLRTKFHLKDPASAPATAGAAEEGVEVGCSVRIRPYNLEPDGVVIHPDGKFPRVRAVPCELVFEPGDKKAEPLPTADGLYRKSFRVRVISGTRPGVGIGGTGIAKDWTQDHFGDWHFAARFDPSSIPQLSAWTTASQWPRPDQKKNPAIGVGQDGYVLFGTAKSSTFIYDHWDAFYDTEQRFLNGQSTNVELSFQAENLSLPVTEFFVGPPHKLYVYVYDNLVGEVGHSFIGLIDPRGVEIRGGQFLQAGDTGYSETTGAVAGGGGGLVLVVGSGLAGGFAWLPAGPIGMIIGTAVIIGGTLVGSVAGVAVTAHGMGAFRDDAIHEYNHRHGYDVTPAEYQAALKEFKRRAQLTKNQKLRYDVTGRRGHGNCATCAESISQAASIRLPYDLDAMISRPGTMASGIDNLPRYENFSDLKATHPHPFVYAPGKKWVIRDWSNKNIDAVLQ